MAKTLNSALSTIYDRFVFTGSTRSEFYYTGGIGGDDTQVTALQLTTLKNVDDEVVLITDASQDVTLSNDLKLLSDASILNFGANNDVHLTHVHNVGLLLSQNGSGSIPVLQIRDSGLTISSSADGQLDIDADTTLEMTAPTIELVGAILNLGENDASDVTINLLGTNNDMAIVYDESAKKLAFDTDVLVVDGSANKVGIGTVSPDTLLHLAATDGSAVLRLEREHVTITDGQKYGSIEWEGQDDSNSNSHGVRAEILVESGGVGSQGETHMIFKTSATATTRNIERLSIDSVGKVGIGANAGTAQSLLDVRGPSGSAFACAGILTLSTADQDIVDNDVLGMIQFQAPSELSGTDAILPGAAIWGEAEGAFADVLNSTALVFATANTQTAINTAQERMRIMSSGNVGIGTASPNELLEISSAGSTTLLLHRLDTDINATAVIGDISWGARHAKGVGLSTPCAKIEAKCQTDWTANANNAGTGLHFYTQDDSDSSTLTTPRMTIDEDGKVGIGMTPDTAFNVKGDDESGIRLYDSNGTAVLAKLEADADSDAVLTLNTGAGAVDIVLNAQSGGDSYIKTGKFGIGTNDPKSTLHVIGSATEGILISSTDANLTTTESHGTIAFAGIDGGIDASLANAPTAIHSQATQTTSATEDGGRLVFATKSDDVNFDAAHTNRWIIQSNGHLEPFANNTYNVGSDALECAQMWVTGNSGHAQTSDERLKTNIQDINGSGLEKINALKPRTFDWKKYRTNPDDELIDKGSEIGFIAQEVKSIIPELAVEGGGKHDFIDEDGNVLIPKGTKGLGLGMAGTTMIAYMVKAIQELSAKVTA